MIQKAKWIWHPAPTGKDSYADFADTFDYSGEGSVNMTLSCDSNYAAYVNGRLTAFGQYADYPAYKIADTVDITPFVRKGANRIAITVWYYGIGSSTYTVGQPGLVYEITQEAAVLAASGTNTLSRINPGYLQGYGDMISGQLGPTFRRDDCAADDRFIAEGAADGFVPAALTGFEPALHPRPNEKLVLRDRVTAKLARTGVYSWTRGDAPQTKMQYAAISYRNPAEISDSAPNARLVGEHPIRFHADGPLFILLDLEKESVGFLDLDLEVPADTPITIGWGEHLDDGVCRTAIRGFFCEYRAKAGRNRYMNPFRRLGCRYLQLFIESGEVILHYAGIRPTEYPLNIRDYHSGNLLRDTIYRACQDTLIACMHEHYEDCPWREQALYTMDSRNQMLCGYYAFGETRFPRAALRLIAEGMTEHGLLSICYPADTPLCIPSFSAVYFIQMKEYIDYSGDTSLAEEVYPVLERLMHTFTDRMENGLLPAFGGNPAFWNFYEWSDTLSGGIGNKDASLPDAPINAFLSLALTSFAAICEAIGKAGKAKELRALCAQLNRAIADRFYDRERKVFITADSVDRISVLTNSLCLLCGAAEGLDTSVILPMLADNGKASGAIPNTLSMNGFRFDALMRADREAYGPVILDEIDREYLYMLRNGATTFWETIRGEEDFNEAGSLCHGWSALPIYYYEVLNNK